MEENDLELWDLYEQYMDEDEINEIIESDNLEEEREKSTKKSRTESKFPEEMAISISDFVNNYLGINADCRNLWHQGLREIGSSLLFGVDNNFANKNPEFVYSGELLLVIDAKGNRGTYINPKYLQDLLESEDVERELEVLSKKGIKDLELLNAYFEKCAQLQTTIEMNRKFEMLLRETHKMKKYNALKKELKHD